MDAFDDPLLRACIRRGTDRRVLERDSLVLTAIDIANGLDSDGTEWRLWVPFVDATVAGSGGDVRLALAQSR
jgi:hypothetical protein